MIPTPQAPESENFRGFLLFILVIFYKILCRVLTIQEQISTRLEKDISKG